MLVRLFWWLRRHWFHCCRCYCCSNDLNCCCCCYCGCNCFVCWHCCFESSVVLLYWPHCHSIWANRCASLKLPWYSSRNIGFPSDMTTCKCHILCVCRTYYFSRIIDNKLTEDRKQKSNKMKMCGHLKWEAKCAVFFVAWKCWLWNGDRQSMELRTPQ